MIITADYLLTGDSTTIIENGAVLVKGKRIVEVATAKQLIEKYPDEEVSNYPNMTLMPGMIDLHNHFGYVWGNPYEKTFEEGPYTLAFWMASRLKDTLKKGVTTVRDVTSPGNIGPQIKWAFEHGFIDSPRIFTSGKGIIMTGGHGAGLKGGVFECDGAQEVIKAVRTNIRDGANYIKILTSEGYRGFEMTQEEINAAAYETHRLNKRIAAHAGYDPSIKMCIEAGIDTIEHGTNLTIEEANEMVKKDLTWVPTIFVFKYVADIYNAMESESLDSGFAENPKVYLNDACQKYKDNFKKLYDTGVRVACGTDTDCAGYPGVAPVAEECKIMVEYGITPLQAIECATKNGAEALGCENQFGMIKEGLSADMILVEGKPFENIADLDNIKAVYLEGQKKI